MELTSTYKNAVPCVQNSDQKTAPQRLFTQAHDKLIFDHPSFWFQSMAQMFYVLIIYLI